MNSEQLLRARGSAAPCHAASPGRGQGLSASSCSGRAAAASAVAPACPLPTGLATPRCHRVPAARTWGYSYRPTNEYPGRPAGARGRIGSASASQPPARSFPRLVCGWGLDISRRPACGRTLCPFPLIPCHRFYSSAGARHRLLLPGRHGSLQSKRRPALSRLLSWRPAPRH
jgi:hypothetical protein